MNLAPPSNADVFAAARAYVAAGISVIPVAANGTKAPAIHLLPPSPDGRRGWGQFRERLATEAELQQWFSAGGAQGIGVINGRISGGLEVIDFDHIDVVAPWADRVTELAPSLGKKLIIVQSPRPGIHIYYRTDSPLPSSKLAHHLVPEDDNNLVTKTLIETKGEGGYTIAPPSAGGCHPSGYPYVYWGNRDLTQVELITVGDRELLLAAARELDELPPDPEPLRPRRRQTEATGTRPGDIFNARANWSDILKPHGWTYVSSNAEIEYWRRPGKSTGVSATVNYANADLLHVFSVNASPFVAGESYSKFSAYTLLKHGGDFTAAATALRQRGYDALLPAGRRGGGRRSTSSRPNAVVSVSVALPEQG